MTVTVQGPGFSVDFPDGTDDATINKQMSVANAQFKTAQRNPDASGDVSVGSVARSLFRGLPGIGTFRDELAARGRSLVGQDYEQGLALERARDKAFSEQHPILDTGLNVAGGVGGTMLAAPAVAGPATAAAVGRTLLGIGAKTLPGAIGRGATAGLVQGALSGAGEAEGGAADRGMGAITGGAIGGMAGGAIPAAFEFARRPVQSLVDRVRGSGDALSRLSAPAQRYVAGISSPEAIARMEQGLDTLGPLGMPADVSPEWNSIARAAAGRPGGRNEIVQPLLDRRAGSNARLQSDFNANLGPAPIPSEIQSGIEAGQEALRPDYGRVFQGAQAANTEPLAQGLEAEIINRRGPAQRSLQEVRRALDVYGAPGNLDPNPGTLHEVRMMIDGLKEGETNPKVLQALADARARVDAELARAVPGVKDVDALHAELARQKEALQRGGQVLDTGKTAIRPKEMADELTAAVQPEGTLVGPSAAGLRIQQGLRAELDRIIGTQGNDARAINNLMRGSEADGAWNPIKMGQVFGEDRARQALGSVDREVTFQNTANRVTGGTDTAQSQQFQKAIDAVESPIVGTGNVGETSLTGLGLNALKRIHTAMIGAVGEARASRFASELGGIAVSQGATRDEFIAAMKRAGLNRAQISRTLDMATRGGLIVSREGPQFLPQRGQ